MPRVPCEIMPINTELFIQTVQNYPVLYDTSHKDYKNNRIKNKIWDSIAEIIGQSDGDSLKKKWKNLRDAYSKHLRSCKTTTGQVAKLIDRYKTWPWANLMSFLRQHLEFAETSSNIIENTEEAGSSQAIDRTSPINTSQSDTHVHSRRKRSSDGSQAQVDKVTEFMKNNREDEDDIELLFKYYAKKLKKMSDRRQALVKFEIAKIMLKAELEESHEMQLISGDGRNSENMVLKVEQPLSSASSCVDDSTYITWSPSPASESVDPLLHPPSHIESSYTQPSYNQPPHKQPPHNHPSHNQPSLTQPLFTQSSYTQPSRTQTHIKKTK